jgi:hypothetical protein
MKFVAKHSATLAALTIFLFGGVSQSELSHGPSPQGNLQRAATATCPALPDGVPVIGGLKTGWAMARPSSSVRLLLSDDVRPCEEPQRNGSPPTEACTDSWHLSLTLPSALQAPGTYNLAEHEVDFAESQASGVANEGCGGPSCSSTGSAGRVADGVVEIYAVTEECIAGRIHRLNNNQTSGADYTGGFLAVRCQAPTQ